LPQYKVAAAVKAQQFWMARESSLSVFLIPTPLLGLTCCLLYWQK